MTVQLIRRNFPDRPDWPVVGENVPIGTRYEVLGYERGMSILNLISGEMRDVECYFLLGNNGTGWMPTVCFEVVKEES